MGEAGIYVEVSLSDGFSDVAKTLEEIQDADQIYPCWEEKLGYTGEASVQAATFDSSISDLAVWRRWRPPVAAAVNKNKECPHGYRSFFQKKRRWFPSGVGGISLL